MVAEICVMPIINVKENPRSGVRTFSRSAVSPSTLLTAQDKTEWHNITLSSKEAADCDYKEV